MLKTEPLADLKTYLRWHLVRSVAPALPTAYAEAAFRYNLSPDRGQAASQPPSLASPSTATSGA